MVETRRCERCGTEFVPKREHARFCTARCRVAWNRENGSRESRDRQQWGSGNWERAPGGGQVPEASALDWAIIAMRDTTQRLGKVRASNGAHAFAVIGEAVWWVTIVDATLVRYYPDEYDAALAGLPSTRRRVTEATFGGLRFVRNRMGYYADHTDFICPRAGAEGAEAPVTEWIWRSLPAPTVDSLPPRGQEWELSRYRAYQDRLAGRPVGDAFAQAAAFLDLATEAVRSALPTAAADGAPDSEGLSASGQLLPLLPSVTPPVASVGSSRPRLSPAGKPGG